jgi:hypothetical protein
MRRRSLRRSDEPGGGGDRRGERANSGRLHKDRVSGKDSKVNKPMLFRRARRLFTVAVLPALLLGGQSSAV